MVFVAEARDFTISGGTFTNNVHRAEGEKGAYFLLYGLGASIMTPPIQFREGTPRNKSRPRGITQWR